MTAQQHSLPDQIAGEKHLGAKAAGRNPAKAFTRVKIVPPGNTPAARVRSDYRGSLIGQKPPWQ